MFTRSFPPPNPLDFCEITINDGLKSKLNLKFAYEENEFDLTEPVWGNREVVGSTGYETVGVVGGEIWWSWAAGLRGAGAKRLKKSECERECFCGGLSVIDAKV